MSSPTAPTSLPDQLADAERELPEEIAAAIEIVIGQASSVIHEAHEGSPESMMRAVARKEQSRAALTTTILSRLTSAEAERDAAIRERDEARADLDKLEDTMAPLSDDGKCVWIDGAGGVPLDYSQGRDLAAALARAERAETSRDAEATKLADELEGWFRHGSYRPGDHLPSSWQHDLGGRIARNMRLVLRALRSCPAAALADGKGDA